MEQVKVNNKSIVKNTLLLYLRTIVAIVVGLYSSRILLHQLGIEEYGVYNLLGSIILMFASLRVAFASATQRFLNYEKVHNDNIKLASIFRTSIKLHNYLCLLFTIIVEVVGVWLINSKFNIPIDLRMPAHIIFQFSVVSSILMILTVPYDAVIISHERFDVFALFSIIESVLKLASAAILIFISSNKLILYGLFILLSALVIRVLNIVYCRQNFPECTIKTAPNPETYREIGKFAGWNFLGNTSFAVYNEGINMILNIFGGAAANAARAICTQIFSALNEICSKLITAVSPQSIQLYAKGAKVEFINLIYFSSKLISYLYLIISVPIYFFTENILTLWLGVVPQHSEMFVKVILFYGLIRALHHPLDLCFKAQGELRQYQLIEILCLLPSIVIAYFFMKLSFPLYFCFIAMIICNIINTICILLLAKKKIGISLNKYLKSVIVPLLIIFFLIYLYIRFIAIPNIYISCILIETITIISIFIFGLTPMEKCELVKLLKFNRDK